MYVAEREEASRILGRALGDPVFKAVRMDEDGVEVAAPVFEVTEKKAPGKRVLRRIILFVLVFAVMAMAWIAAVMAFGLAARADGPGYGSVGETQDGEVIGLTEEIGEIYSICPELLQAVVFYESSNRRTVVSRWGDIGYMQVNPRWQQARMEKLGVTDLMDGYSNILVGTDYLHELSIAYEDPALVLMCYNQGEEKAVRLYNEGQVSGYAKDVLELSEKLERLHGK